MAGDWSDQKVELEIGQLLRAGVLLGAAVMLAGGILYLHAFGSSKPQYHQFHAARGGIDVGAIFRRAIHWDPRSVIDLAVLLLIATPVARVAFAAYAFLRQKDWMYTFVTLGVLSLLLFAIFYGI